MGRWITCLWQALVTFGETEYPYVVSNDDIRRPREYQVDLTDDAVRGAFRELVEREWGSVAFSDTAPPCQSWRAEPDGNSRRPPPDPFWGYFLFWRSHLPW